MEDAHQLPRGFQANGGYCGIKQDASTLDLALFVSETPCSAAGVFTQNKVVGAPVKLSRKRVPGEHVRGVVINSGNANACTGKQGETDALWMTAEVARLLGCEPDAVLVCSTGIIGRKLPREQLAQGFPAVAANLSGDVAGFHAAARGMMTTDTFAKQIVRECTIAGKTVRVSGAAKGAAMIAPDMATMLAVILTDAPLGAEQADAMLRNGVNDSFNCISVEGHMSTSDTVLLLANGAADVALNSAGADHVAEMIADVCTELAKMIVRDAEGAKHFVTIEVTGARTRAEARQVAKTVAESALVKTAITGNDPNWGRIVSAVGYSGIEVAEEQITLSINGVTIYQSGTPLDIDEPGLSKSMDSCTEVEVCIQLDLGSEAIRFWTSDLTTEYVKLNSEYTT